MNLNILVIFICSFIVSTYQWSWGTCPTKNYVLSFKPQKFSGQWYEFGRYAEPLWESYSSCNNFHFQPIYNSSDNNLTFISPVSSSPYVVPISVSSISGLSYDANFKWKFQFPLFNSVKTVYILATNYYDYAVVWTCDNYYALNFQTVWLLSREKDPSNVWIFKAIEKALELNGLENLKFTKVAQENCPS